MALSPLGGSGKTYRLANNLTIDYYDFDELETLWTNQVVSDKEVMQIIAASAETMELHAQTPFVMDAVSASQTARDAIGTDGVGYDAVGLVAEDRGDRHQRRHGDRTEPCSGGDVRRVAFRDGQYWEG